MPTIDTASLIKQNAAKRGIEVTVTSTPLTDANGNPVLDKDGNPIVSYSTIIDKVPDVEAEAMAFFTPSYISPCKEISSLLAQYKREMMNSKSCKSCTRGKLIRKYLPLVKDALRRYAIKHPGSGSLPGSIKVSTGRTQEKRTLLQRASSGLATIFKIGSRKG